MTRAASVALATLLVVAALPVAHSLSGQETGVEIRAWYDRIGGNGVDLTRESVWIEVVETVTSVRLSTDDPGTASRICRSGDATDVCVPPGGDAFLPSEQHRAYLTLQPGEWSVGDPLAVTITLATDLSSGVSTVALREGGVVVDVVVKRPAEGIALLVVPPTRPARPEVEVSYEVIVGNFRLVPDTLSLAIAQVPPGWIATLDASSFALAPDEVATTKLRVTPPVATMMPYAPAVRPARAPMDLHLQSAGASYLDRSASVVTSVPFLAEIRDFIEAEPFAGLVAACALPPVDICYPDPTQTVEFNVRVTWFDGTPVPAVPVVLDIRSPRPLGLFGPIAPLALVGATDAAGIAHFVVPRSVSWGLPEPVEGPGGWNLPGVYDISMRASLGSHSVQGGARYAVGPVAPRG